MQRHLRKYTGSLVWLSTVDTHTSIELFPLIKYNNYKHYQDTSKCVIHRQSIKSELYFPHEQMMSGTSLIISSYRPVHQTEPANYES